MKYTLIALFFGAPLLLVWLTKGDRPFWQEVVEGSARARRTRWERQADARLEELQSLPPDLEIDAYTFYFDPAFPQVRAELLPRLARRQDLAKDFRWIFAHGSTNERLWAIDVVKDLRPASLPALGPAINQALIQIAAGVHEAPDGSARPAPFHRCEDWARRLVAAIPVLVAAGADCRAGLRAIIGALERCPETKARNVFLAQAAAALADASASLSDYPEP